eukprot:1559924-Heterocapsa_arctica.AAC.1
MAASKCGGGDQLQESCSRYYSDALGQAEGPTPSSCSGGAIQNTEVGLFSVAQSVEHTTAS